METKWMPWVFEYRLEQATKKIQTLERQLAKAHQELTDIEARVNDPTTWTLDELELSIRTYNCLKNNGQFSTVGELIQASATDLLKIHHFGKGCLAEVEQVLTNAGLSLVRPGPRLKVAQ